MATYPQNYYMISNRTYDSSTGTFGTTVATGGALTFLQAPAASPTTFTVVSQSVWLGAVQQDLRANGSGATAACNIFFHGYGVTYDGAVKDFPEYFNNLQNTPSGAGYSGVQIGFDWPSDDDAGGTMGHGGAQQQAFQNAKANARTTGSESFPLLYPVLQSIVATTGVQGVSLTAICHSMGNYLMYCGAGAFAQSSPLFNEIICAAAMLNFQSFNSAQSPTYSADIVAATKQVTVYYSSHDDVLPFAEQPGYDGYKELGIYGPTYGTTLLAGVVGVDCSEVVNKANTNIYEQGWSPKLTHTSYFFIPEVLEDISFTLAGGQGGDGDRQPIAGSNGAGFTMVPT